MYRTRRNLPAILRSVWLGVLLVLGSVALSPKANATEILVPPILDVQRPDGSRDIERSGQWRYSAPDRDVQRVATAPNQRRQIVFLLDVSGSMPRVHGSRGSFDDVVQRVVERATSMLQPYAASEAFEVSFYRFGDLRQASDGTWQPHVQPVPGGVNVSVRDAIALLPTFVPVDPGAYRDPHTYVAASVFEAIRIELELDRSPEQQIPSDRPLAAIFVFTDAGDPGLGGGESHGSQTQRRFNNQPYASWLTTHSESHQLEYHYWNLEQVDSRVLQPPARTTYLVSWGDGGRVDVVNRRGSSELLEREFDAPPVIRLAPALSDPDTQGRRVCSAPADNSIVAMSGNILRLERTGPATFRLGDLARYAGGRHGVGFDADALCDELMRVYPNSSFVLPGQQSAIAALGFVEIVEHPHYTFVLRGDGIAAEAALGPLQADRFGVFEPAARALVVDSPSEAGLDSRIDWTLRVFHSNNGEPVPVDPAEGLAALRFGEALGPFFTTASNGVLGLALPAFEQSWIPFVGQRLQVPAGAYYAEVCASVDLVQAPVPVYTLALECRECAASSGPGEEQCVTLPFLVEKRPISWWCIFSILAAVVAFLALLGRYRFMAPPPHGLKITMEFDGSTYSGTLERPPLSGTHILDRFFQRPVYLTIFSNGSIRFEADDPIQKAALGKKNKKKQSGAKADNNNASSEESRSERLVVFSVYGANFANHIAKFSLHSEPAVQVKLGKDLLTVGQKSVAAKTALLKRKQRLSIVVGEMRGEAIAPGAPSFVETEN